MTKSKIFLIATPIILVTLGFIAAIFMFVMSLMKGDAFQLSLDAVRSNPDIVAIYGEPIEAGFFVEGQVKTYNGGGSAAMNYSISGPKSSGRVFMGASKSQGTWNLVSLIVTDDATGKSITITNGVMLK
jgi:hypothetical protein